MTLDEFQAAARRTINPRLNAQDRLLDSVAGLSEEAGELLGLIRKRTFQSRDAPRERLAEELGDALWCLAVTADALDIPLEEVAAINLAKLEARHPDGFSSTRTADQWSRAQGE